MNKKVLVVDDDVDILDGISIILESEGFHVETTTKGDEAYQRVERFQPDVIVLDVLMSGNDGRIICKNLKSQAETRQIPIIMISADPNVKQSSVESGAHKFLSKPFDIDDFINTVHTALHGPNSSSTAN